MTTPLRRLREAAIQFSLYAVLGGLLAGVATLTWGGPQEPIEGTEDPSHDRTCDVCRYKHPLPAGLAAAPAPAPVDALVRPTSYEPEPADVGRSTAGGN